MAHQKSSPWLGIGCGCCALGCLGLLLAGSAGLYGFSFLEDYFTGLADPQTREQRALEMLGTDTLPPGYTVQTFFGIPGLFDAVLLNDSAATLDSTEGDLAPAMGEHVFTFVSIWNPGEESIDPFDKDPEGNVQFDVGVQIEPWEDLGSGGWEIPGGKLAYSSHKGEIRAPDGEWVRGIYSKTRIDCQQGNRARAALWFYQTPIDRTGPEADPETIPRTENPADETALRTFLSNFSLCPS